MILSISDINRKIKNNIIAMGMISIFCLVFSSIYNEFGHGVNSFYMTFLFLWPLLGVVLYLVMFILNFVPSRITINAVNGGIAALTSGSLVKGILEIAGTSSDYEIVFFIIGIGMILIGAIDLIKNSK